MDKTKNKYKVPCKNKHRIPKLVHIWVLTKIKNYQHQRMKNFTYVNGAQVLAQIYFIDGPLKLWSVKGLKYEDPYMSYAYQWVDGIVKCTVLALSARLFINYSARREIRA